MRGAGKIVNIAGNARGARLFVAMCLSAAEAARRQSENPAVRNPLL